MITAKDLLDLLLQAEAQGVDLNNEIFISESRIKDVILTPAFDIEIDPTENNLIIYY